MNLSRFNGKDLFIFLFGIGCVIGSFFLTAVDGRTNLKNPKVIFRLTVTAYRPIKAQTDGSPLWTSIGATVTMGICAVSRDLLESGELEYGDLVEIDGLGVYKVADCMAARHKRHVDVLVYTLAQEKLVGWRKHVKVRRLRE